MAAFAEANGAFGRKVSSAANIRDTVSEMFSHPGPSLLDVDVNLHEQPLPGKIEYQQAKKFAEAFLRGQPRGPGTSAVAAGPWIATYRLQLQPGFGFDEAAAVIGYLAELGVSHVYLSPCLQAAQGSTSGYDVTDHSRLNEALGGADAYGRLTRRLTEAGLGQLLDIVPNHMALAGRANAWWWDVLENGPSSRYAGYFDIDWDPPERKLTATVLMPVQ